MSVTARKKPCPVCGEPVVVRDVYEQGECPECGASRSELFLATREDPKTIGEP